MIGANNVTVFRDLNIGDTFSWVLNIGDTFHWVNDGNSQRNYFFYRCVKLSARTYTKTEGEDLQIYKVGSTKSKVFHVTRKQDVIQQ